MPHVSLDFIIVCIFQLIPDNWLNVSWINFMRTTTRAKSVLMRK
jgi:hypothetical protein